MLEHRTLGAKHHQGIKTMWREKIRVPEFSTRSDTGWKLEISDLGKRDVLSV